MKGKVSRLFDCLCYFSTTPTNKSFYRRNLPAHLIPLDSYSGKKLFEESLHQGNCETFFPLVQQFITQNNPSTCAPATLAMILNALKVDPGRNWKGIWRWFDEFNIQHMHESKLIEGLTLQEFDNLTRLNNARSMAFSPLLGPGDKSGNLRQSSLSLFRNSLIACSRRSNMFMSVNFHRKSLQQTGIGHYSPFAAYNAKEDMALILDVAKFKYDSYWCSIEQIYEALKPLDQTSQQSRGFLIAKRKYEEDVYPNSPFCSLEIDLQTNSKLNDIIDKHKDISNCLISILNETSLHSVLIPILYEFSTHQIDSNAVTRLAHHQEIQQLAVLADKVNEEAIKLLSAYAPGPISITLLYLALVLKLETNLYLTNRYGHFGGEQMRVIRLIRRSQLCLELNVRPKQAISQQC